MKKKIKHKQVQANKTNLPKPLKSMPAVKWNNYTVLLVIMIISFLAYLPVFNNKLLAWDDDRYITDNPIVHSINFGNIFSSYVMGNYHPLTILTFAVEYQFFGINGDGYHTVNLLLHLLNVFLVYRVVLLLSERSEERRVGKECRL